MYVSQFKIRSRVRLSLLLVLVISLAAGCGSNASEGASATTAPATMATSETGGVATADASGATVSTGVEGGTLLPGQGTPNEGELAPPDQQNLRVRLVSDPETIDPALDQDVSEETTVKQLFTNLTRLKPNLEPEGAVAESWQFNADNTQITFKLRDTKWSDGRPLTAKDFEYSWKRFIDPSTASPYTALVTGVIKGATELNSAQVPTDTARLPQLRDNLGVKAIDDQTLQVDLEIPAPFFPSIAALGNLAPVREDVVEKFGDRWTEPGNLIGNGPFALKSRTKGTEILLVANPNYYEGPPKLATLLIKTITDDPTALANYEADEIDIDQQVPPAEIPGLRADAQYQNQIVPGTTLSTYFYTFNVTQPPFDNLKVRQAFAAAIDRETLIKQVLNDGGQTAAYSFIPPGMPGHLTEAEAGDAAQKFDVANAKQLLADAGYPDGKGFPEVKLPFNNCCSHDLIAQRIQSDLQSNLGVKVTLDPRESTTYFSEVRRNPPAFFRNGWNADYGDPFDWDRLVFGPDSEQNYGKWKNDEFTKLLDQADKAKTPEQRIGYYKQAEEVLARDSAAVFVYWYGRFSMVKPWVKGLNYTAQDPTVGAYFYKDAQILKH